MKTRTALLGTLAVAAGAAVTASGVSGAAVPPGDSVRPGAAVAAESSPVGYASMNGGTTGGAGGATVTATNASQLNTYATASAPYVIRITGTIAVSGMQKVASNKTVIASARPAGSPAAGSTSPRPATSSSATSRSPGRATTRSTSSTRRTCGSTTTTCPTGTTA